MYVFGTAMKEEWRGDTKRADTVFQFILGQQFTLKPLKSLYISESKRFTVTATKTRGLESPPACLESLPQWPPRVLIHFLLELSNDGLGAMTKPPANKFLLLFLKQPMD